jgi:hypothetical protein
MPPQVAGPELRLVACLNPFSTARSDVSLPAGGTILELLRAAGADAALIRHAHVAIDSWPIAREHWRVVRPKPGRLVTVRVVPGLGGGQGGGKSPLRIILSIAVLAASFVLGPALGAALGGAVYGAGFGTATIFGLAAGPIFNAIGSGLIGLAGNLLVNAIAPPPRPRLADRSGLSGAERTSPTLSITGAQNRASPYGPVPRVFGSHRVFPLYGAAPFTEIVGSDQYLRLLFDVGYGPLALSQHRIGTTPIEQFEGVELEIRAGSPGDAAVTLYSNQVVEDQLSIKLTNSGGPQVLESRDNADEVTADLTFNGLVSFGPNGERNNHGVTIRIEFRLAGSGSAWTSVGEPSQVQSSAVTLLADLGESREYRTDAALGGPLALTLVTSQAVQSPGGDLTTTHTWSWNVYARSEGDAAWVLHSSGAAQQVSIAGAVGKRLELRLERFAIVDLGGSGAPAFPAPAFSYPTFVVGDIQIVAATEQVVRRNLRIRPGVKGRYEVRFTRLTADTTATSVRDEAFITALRTIRYAPPTNVVGHCLVAMRIKASNQLQGVISTYNCVASAALMQWNGSVFHGPLATSNAAWCALEVLRGSANKRAIPDARIDLPSFLDLAIANDVAADGAAKFQFDAVVDSRSTVIEMANDILATCRAQLSMRDGKFSVVRDKPQSVPVQMFTPRNSWGFRATKQFLRRPHALKCRFVNPAKDWSQDEVTVYDDGQSAATATEFETLDMFGVTRPAQAHRDGRYHLAVAKLRPETYELSVDIEHIVARRGELVRVAHDVPRWGLHWGRVKSLTTDGGGNITSLTLDELVTLEPGKSYAVRVRNAKNAQSVATVQGVSVVTETATLTLAQLLPPSSAAAGDLCAFGESTRESVELLVKSIRRIGDFNARLELVDAAPGVHTADSGAIPPFDTQSTWPGQGANLAPAAPIVAEIRSDEDAMVELPGGGWQAAIRVTLGQSSGVAVDVASIEAQSRRAGSAEAWDVQRFDGSARVIYVVEVDERQAYDLRLRAVAPAGAASDWTLIANHLVVGRSAPPPIPTRVLIENGLLVADYPSPPRDFAGFRIEYHRGVNKVRAGAVRAHAAPTVPLPFDLSGLEIGAVTLFVLAVDTSGNESAPAILVLDLGLPERDNVIDTLDLGLAGFPGTLSNGELVGGILRALSDPAELFLPSANDPFLGDDAATFLPTTYLNMQYLASFVPAEIDVPSQLTIDAVVTGTSWQLDYRGAGDELFLPDAAAPFLPDAAALFLGGPPAFGAFPGSIRARRERLEFRLTTSAGAVRGQIDAFVVRFDVPDQEERINNLALPSTGGRLPLTRAYRRIDHVDVTLQFDGNGAESALVIDKDATLGPLVQAFNAGIGVAALIDAEVKGVAA